MLENFLLAKKQVIYKFRKSKFYYFSNFKIRIFFKCFNFRIWNFTGNNDFKSAVDNTSEKGSTISVEVSSSVRFAKKVTIESAITSSPKSVREIMSLKNFMN